MKKPAEIELNLGEKELGEISRKFLRGNRQFYEAYDIVERNSKGDIWLIGGYLYGNLAKEIYGEMTVFTPGITDIDFLLEGQIRDFYMPLGWELKFTDYGNPYFVRGNERIDLNNLLTFSSILMRKLSPTLVHFLTGTPLNIQSIAYDCKTGEVIARKAGIDAINHRVLRINNHETARDEARRRGISIEEMLKTKADELGFRYSICREIK
ncbi:MAG: hypothetical protein PHH00_02025 [Candidatus Nanoarchaeia archaeon]|nr:hypothetical protein [Candidatus Nanoarchaeia archaeon]